MPNRPYAAPGIPKGRVAPVHGPERRIGTGDPRAVAQLQAGRRLAEFLVRTPERDFPAQAPRCQMRTSGSATDSAERRSNPGSGNALRNRPPVIASGRADTRRILIRARGRRQRLRPSSTAPSSISSRRRRSRQSSRLAGPSRVTSAGSSATTGQRSAARHRQRSGGCLAKRRGFSATGGRGRRLLGRAGTTRLGWLARPQLLLLRALSRGARRGSPRLRGFGGARCVFVAQKLSGRGYPGPLHDIRTARAAPPRNGPSPEPRGRTPEPRDLRAARPRRRGPRRRCPATEVRR